MTDSSMMKLNYDDYYKFLVSLGCIIFVVSSGLLYYLGSTKTVTWFVSFWLTVFLVTSLILFYMGVSGWKSRQKNLDELLSLDVEIKTKQLEYFKLDIQENTKKESDSVNRLNKLNLKLRDITGAE